MTVAIATASGGLISTLNELLAGQAVTARDAALIDREYNQCKYAPAVFAGKSPDAVHYEQCSMRGDVNSWLFSENDAIRCADLPSVIARMVAKVQAAVNEFASETIVELGCGYGFWADKFPGKKYLGGEYTANGVQAARNYGYDVRRHDYNNRQDYGFIPDGATVLTVASIEQIASARPFLDALDAIKTKIARVIQFEPSVLPGRTSELGRFRNRYIAHHKYCPDLHCELHSRSNIRIIREDLDFFGVVPLNPVNLYVWEHKDG